MKLLTPFKLLVLAALLLCVLHANAASSLITFADPEVERICVENWDADGDGKLSEKEAESVSWLSWMVFSGKPITTFDELAYFKNLRTIGQAAFGQCKNLKSIKIPKNVTEIGMSAFADCISLVSIDIPKGVTEIQNWTFENCQSLTSISLPEGVITLKEKAFFGCSGLKTITLPSTIQEIGNYVFYGLASIQDVYCYATVVPQVTANSFSNNIAEGSNLPNATLHVPVGCVDAYRNAQGWKEFKTIVEVEKTGDSEWYLITDNNEQFKMSTVSMLVAADDSQYFSVLDLNGNVLAEDVLRVHFLKIDPSSVEYIMVDEPQNMLKRYVNNQLTLVGARGTVNIYSVSGVMVASTHAMGQETIIDVSALPAGTYILQCGKLSFKFNKK